MAHWRSLSLAFAVFFLGLLCDAEVTQLDSSQEVSLARGRGRGRLRVVTSFSLAGASSNRAGNDEELLGAAQEATRSCHERADQMAVELRKWKERTRALIDEVEARKQSAILPKSQKLGDLLKQVHIERASETGSEQDTAPYNPVRSPSSKFDVFDAQEMVNTPHIDAWHNWDYPPPPKMRKWEAYHFTNGMPIKKGNKFRNEPWVCSKTGERLANFRGKKKSVVPKWHHDYGRNDGCVPFNLHYLVPGECVTKMEDGRRECSCYDGWQSIIPSGSGSRKDLRNIIKALLSWFRTASVMVQCILHVRAEQNVKDPTCDQFIDSKIMGGTGSLELGERWGKLKKAVKSVRKTGAKVLKAGRKMVPVGGLLKRMRKKLLKFLLKQVANALPMDQILGKDPRMKEMTRGTIIDNLKMVENKMKLTDLTEGSGHVDYQGNYFEGNYYSGYFKPLQDSKPGGPFGNQMVYELSTPMGGGTETKCKYKLSAVMSGCNTCCCKHGIVSLPIESELVEDKDPSCSHWFTLMDVSFRIVMSVWRAGYILRHQALCDKADETDTTETCPADKDFKGVDNFAIGRKKPDEKISYNKPRTCVWREQEQKGFDYNCHVPKYAFLKLGGSAEVFDRYDKNQNSILDYHEQQELHRDKAGPPELKGRKNCPTRYACINEEGRFC